MIITRYLMWETVKRQLALLFILLLVFLCHKLGQLLDKVVEGDIPPNVVLSLLCFHVPAMVQLILPPSLFLGLLVTLSRMYAASEITVMYACGFGKSILLRVALLLSLMTAIVAAVNVIWLSPGFSRYQARAIAEAKVNPSTAMLIEGRFKPADHGNLVLFVGKVKDQVFEHIFLAQLKPNCKTRPFVVRADRGQLVHLADGLQLLILDNGTRYEGTALLRDLCITSFAKYQSLIGYRSVALDNTEAKQMTLHQLWHSPELEARAEFHWRLTLVFSVLIMTMIVVPLSVVNQRQSLLLRILPAMLLYLLFFLLQITLCSHGAQGMIDPMFWLWMTNVLFLALGMVLNLGDTVPIRRLLCWLRGAH